MAGNMGMKKSADPMKKKVSSSHKPVFVVHRHLAHQLHFDFRLETAGVLKSWAVPKGPSMNSGDKRLAVQVEDHPLEYQFFKGVIPEGYGAGIVEIWDRGSYQMGDQPDGEGDRKAMKKSLAAGHARFILKGRKLKGHFALVRTDSGKSRNWLLIKQADGYSVKKRFDANQMTAASSPINRKLALNNKKRVKE